MDFAKKIQGDGSEIWNDVSSLNVEEGINKKNDLC